MVDSVLGCEYRTGAELSTECVPTLSGPTLVPQPPTLLPATLGPHTPPSPASSSTHILHPTTTAVQWRSSRKLHAARTPRAYMRWRLRSLRSMRRRCARTAQWGVVVESQRSGSAHYTHTHVCRCRCMCTCSCDAPRAHALHCARVPSQASTGFRFGINWIWSPEQHLPLAAQKQFLHAAAPILCLELIPACRARAERIRPEGSREGETELGLACFPRHCVVSPTHGFLSIERLELPEYRTTDAHSLRPEIALSRALRIPMPLCIHTRILTCVCSYMRACCRRAEGRHR